jgi:hypothetical protein
MNNTVDTLDFTEATVGEFAIIVDKRTKKPFAPYGSSTPFFPDVNEAAQFLRNQMYYGSWDQYTIEIVRTTQGYSLTRVEYPFVVRGIGPIITKEEIEKQRAELTIISPKPEEPKDE